MNERQIGALAYGSGVADHHDVAVGINEFKLTVWRIKRGRDLAGIQDCIDERGACRSNVVRVTDWPPEQRYRLGSSAAASINCASPDSSHAHDGFVSPSHANVLATSNPRRW